MRRLAAATACLAAAAVAGCGSSSGGGYGNGSSTATPGGTASTPAPAPRAGAAVQVVMRNIAFNPTTSTARVGQTVKWTNMDGVPHTVTAVKGENFKSKDLEPGQSYSYKVDKVGTVQYVCTIHPQMKATLQVVR